MQPDRRVHREGAAAVLGDVRLARRALHEAEQVWDAHGLPLGRKLAISREIEFRVRRGRAVHSHQGSTPTMSVTEDIAPGKTLSLS